ncbi:hypothetical protein ElyMa_003856900 [Elysia marginata]|uniref:Uncharacterized protein n=1 Tax=Elysia marginata TaxID=1093978 RepID=A0AAV4FI15_9GAST|nr:hypothetical protein ElyMa_003856900 [Elysia marginata]
MYNPVAQRRRARSVRRSNSSNSPEGTLSLGDISATPGVEDLETETSVHSPKSRQTHKRRGKRRAQAPTRKPPWNSCTIIRPQQQQSDLNQTHGVCRKRVPGGRRPLNQNESPPKKSQDTRTNKVKIERIGDGCITKRKGAFPVTKVSNVSNNQRRSTCDSGNCFKRRPGLPLLSYANRNCHRKKTVAFYPEPVTCSQSYDPVEGYQHSKANPIDVYNSKKKTKSRRSIIRIQKSERRKCECCQMASDRRLHANSRLYSSAVFPQRRSPKTNERNTECSTRGQTATEKSIKNRLTSMESKAFMYLAKRLLNKDSQQPSLSKGQVQKSFCFRDPNNTNKQFARCSTLKQSPYLCAGKYFESWDSPNSLQHRGRSKSRLSKKKIPPFNKPRSKSLSNFNLTNSIKQQNSRSSRFALNSVDACTKAMSNMQLKERELLHKYGPSPSDSGPDCSTNCFSKYPFNTQMTRPWDSHLTAVDGYPFDKVSNLFNKTSDYDNGKLPYSWNSSKFETNFSQNRYPNSPARVRTPLGTPDVFFRHYNPPTDVTGSSTLPWSSILKMSTLQPRPFASVPCAEVRLIGKYLDEDNVSCSSQGRKPSVMPGRMSTKVGQEMTNSNAEVDFEAKADGHPWKRVEGISNRISNSFKLEKMLGKSVTNEGSKSGASFNFLEGWRKRAAEIGNKFASCYSELGKTSSYEEGTTTADDRCSASLGSVHNIDRLGSDTIFASAVNAPFSAAAYSLHVPDSCASQSTVAKISTLADDWQTGKASGPRAMESCLKGEEERLRRISLILG